MRKYCSPCRKSVGTCQACCCSLGILILWFPSTIHPKTNDKMINKTKIDSIIGGPDLINMFRWCWRWVWNKQGRQGLLLILKKNGMNSPLPLTPFVGQKRGELAHPWQVLGLHSLADPNRQVYLALSSKCRWAHGTFCQCSYGKWELYVMLLTSTTAFRGCPPGKQISARPSWDQSGNASCKGFLQTSMLCFPADWEDSESSASSVAQPGASEI